MPREHLQPSNATSTSKDTISVNARLKMWFNDLNHIIYTVLMGILLLLMLGVLNMSRDLQVFSQAFSMAQTTTVVRGPA